MNGVVPAWITDAGVAAAVFTAIGGAIIMLNRFVRSALDQFDEKVESHLVPMHELIKEIQGEVTYNHGTSLKDITRQNSQQITRLSVQMAAQADLAAGVASDLVAAHARADAVGPHEEAGAAADAASQTE